MNPLTGKPSSQASMTLGASRDKEIGILASTDVSASGMSDGGPGAVTGRNFILVTIVEESDYDKAAEIIRKAGGFD